jgi:hypothetical protein
MLKLIVERFKFSNSQMHRSLSKYSGIYIPIEQKQFLRKNVLKQVKRQKRKSRQKSLLFSKYLTI